MNKIFLINFRKSSSNNTKTIYGTTKWVGATIDKYS